MFIIPLVACIDRDLKPPQGPMCSYGLITDKSFGEQIITVGMPNHYNQMVQDSGIADRYKHARLMTMYTHEFRLYEHQYRGSFRAVNLSVRELQRGMVILWDGSPSEVVFLDSKAFVLDLNHRQHNLVSNENDNINSESMGGNFKVKVLLRSFVKPEKLYDLGWQKHDKLVQMSRNSIETYQLLMHNEQHQTFHLVAYELKDIDKKDETKK